jgi:hypothetical protein
MAMSETSLCPKSIELITEDYFVTHLNITTIYNLKYKLLIENYLLKIVKDPGFELTWLGSREKLIVN